MPIKIRIIRNDSFNDIDIYFVKIFNIRLDFDEFIKKTFSDKSNSVTLNSILYNIGLVVKGSNIIKKTMKQVRISKLTWIFQVNLENEELEMYGTVASWNSICILRNFMYKYFKSVKNEYYSVQTSDEKINTSFEMVLNFRIIYLLFSVLTNFKDIKRIKTFIKKGNEKNV